MVHAVDIALCDRGRTLQLLKHNMYAAQNRMKILADSHHTEREFQLHDWVYLRLQKYRQSTTATQSYSKLSPKFFGPFQIIARISSVAYRLNLPSAGKLHHIFHVSCLKQSLGANVTISSNLPVIEDQSSGIPEQLLDTKYHLRELLWLIKWDEFDVEDAT